MSETDASEKETLEELASLSTFRNPKVSDKGDRLALYYDTTGRNELHVMDLETGEVEQWSDGEVPRSSSSPLFWGGNDERIYFHLDDGGDTQYDIYSIDSEGVVERVLETEGRTEIRDTDGSGERLLVASDHEGVTNLYIHDVGTGETERITDYESLVGAALFSPDGDRIAYMTNQTESPNNGDVYVAESDGSNPRKLDIGEKGSKSYPVDWSPDSGRLLVVDNVVNWGVYSFENGEVTWFEDGYDEMAKFFMPGGDRVVSARLQDVTTVPVVHEVGTGESRELDIRDSVTKDGIHPMDDNRILLTHTGPKRRPELILYDLETDEYEVLIEAEYGSFSQDDFVDAEHLRFESDGVPETRQHAVDHDPYKEFEIDALLYDSGTRPSPLIVNPHGGPYYRDSKKFDLYTQFLATQDYSVLQVNYRGSLGRGWSFREELYGDRGGAEQGDIATGVEYVLDEYDWIDEDRVAVFGGSYGGYSAYWQMVQYPELYDAGIAWMGTTDLKKQYEESTSLRFWMEAYLGTPDKNPELYEKRSPITHVENLNSPLLILHGVNDPLVPVSQARIFRDALEERGWVEGSDGDFEYIELREEGHGSVDIDQKIRMFSHLDDFLKRRL